MAALKSNLALEVLPKAEQISSAVFRVLGLNPGTRTLQGTNTYIVGTGKERILIDTGEPNRPDYTQLLKDSLTSLQARLSHIILTHHHLDHIGGVESVWKMNGETHPKLLKLPLPPSSQHSDKTLLPPALPLEYLSDGDVVKGVGVSLRVVATPGHTEDHMALLLEEENALFSGDCILGQGTAVFENLLEYMNSLEKIKALNPSRIYPGHGPILEDPMPVISSYIQHRMARETQILEVLQKSSDRPLESMEIVEVIYKDIPKILWPSANGNVLLHLQKLVTEGRVAMKENKYSFITTSFL